MNDEESSQTAELNSDHRDIDPRHGAGFCVFVIAHESPLAHQPLDAQIIEPVTGKVDPELEAHLGVEAHGVLFTHPDLQSGRFPLLSRIRDYYSDADYTSDELQALIAELEQVGVLFEPHGAVSRFLGPFHSLCCLAFWRKKSVALYAD